MAVLVRPVGSPEEIAVVRGLGLLQGGHRGILIIIAWTRLARPYVPGLRSLFVRRSAGSKVTRDLAMQEHRPDCSEGLPFRGATDYGRDLGSTEPETDQADDGLHDNNGCRGASRRRRVAQPTQPIGDPRNQQPEGTHHTRTRATATRSRTGRPDSPFRPRVCGTTIPTPLTRAVRCAGHTFTGSDTARVGRSHSRGRRAWCATMPLSSQTPRRGIQFDLDPSAARMWIGT